MQKTDIEIAAAMLTQHVSPDVAVALRSKIELISRAFQTASYRNDLGAEPTLAAPMDAVRPLLCSISDMLQLPSVENARRLVRESTEYGRSESSTYNGFHRFVPKGILLLQLVIENTEEALCRAITRPEMVALHHTVDLAVLYAAMGFLDRNRLQVEAAAESQLKHLSFLSHDMKNNLSAVSLHLQLLREQLQPVPHMSEEVAWLDLTNETIRRTANGMTRLLTSEQLRDRCRRRSEAGSIGDDFAAFATTPVNLRCVAEDVAVQLKPLAAAKHLMLAVQVPPNAIVCGVHDLIALILQNLLGNGIKYSTAGTVRVHAQRSIDLANGPWVLAVSDEGPGISPSHQARIFEAFARGEASGFDGTGLGLAIARDAARLLGAKLTVESQIGIGSTFRLIFSENSIYPGKKVEQTEPQHRAQKHPRTAGCAGELISQPVADRMTFQFFDWSPALDQQSQANYST